MTTRILPMLVKEQSQFDWRQLNWLVIPALIVSVLVSLAWLDEARDAVNSEKGRNIDLSLKIAELESGPQVRLEGAGFTCRTTQLREGWQDVVRGKCEELATALRLARTGP